MGNDFLFTITDTLMDILKDRNWDDESCGIKREIMYFFSNSLCYDSNCNTRTSSKRIMEMFKVSLLFLNEARYPYMEGLILNDLVDVDELDTIYTLVLSVLTYFGNIIISDRNEYKELINNCMSELIYLLLFYIQLSENELMGLNPSDLLLEYDMNLHSVRGYSLYLVKSLCHHDKFKDFFEANFMQVLQSVLEEAHYQNFTDSPCSWKLHEACYYVISCQDTTMMSCVYNYEIVRFILSFLTEVVEPDLSSRLPILQGTALAVCCSFLQLRTETDIELIIALTLKQITPHSDQFLRALCVRALNKTYRDFGEEETTKNNVLRSQLSAVFETCLNTLTSVKYDVQGRLLELTVMLIIYEPQLCLNREMRLMKNTLGITQGTFRVKNAILCQALFNLIIPLGLCTEAIQKTWMPHISHVLSSQDSSREQRKLMQDIYSIFLRVKPPLNEFSV